MRILLALLALSLCACHTPPPAPTPHDGEPITITFTTPTHNTDGTPIPQSVPLRYHVLAGRLLEQKYNVGTIDVNNATLSVSIPVGEVCFQLVTENVQTQAMSQPTTETAEMNACTVISENPDTDPPRVSETWTATLTNSIPPAKI